MASQFPLGGLPLNTQLELLNAYIALCDELMVMVGKATEFKVKSYEPRGDWVAQVPGHEDVPIDPRDFGPIARDLVDAQTEAYGVLHVLEELTQNPRHFEEHPEELAEWLENVIFCKRELELAYSAYEANLEEGLQGQEAKA